MIAALLLLGSCTKEKLVYGDHDVNVTIEQTKEKREAKVAYLLCDEMERTQDSDARLLAYLNAREADIAIVAQYKAQDPDAPRTQEFRDSYPYHISHMDNGRITSIFAKSDIVRFDIAQGILSESPLCFEYDGTRFVVGALVDKVVPATGENEGPDPIAENHALRKAEAEHLIAQTIDHADNHSHRRWVFLLDMNSASLLDARFGKTIDEQEAAANSALTYHGLVDCVATNFSLYTPSRSDNSRESFVYTTHKVWQNISSLEVDTSVATPFYPILFTLKSKE